MFNDSCKLYCEQLDTSLSPFLKRCFGGWYIFLVEEVRAMETLDIKIRAISHCLGKIGPCNPLFNLFLRLCISY